MTIKLLTVSLVLVAAAGALMLSHTPAPVTRARALSDQDFSRLPLYFIENRGQLDRRVDFYLRGRDRTVHFTGQGLTFRLPSDSARRWALKLDFVGANPAARPRGQDPTAAVVSYFKGAPGEWQTGLRTYASIIYADLWPGVDLIYSGTVNRLKYTFVVKPGADPARIKLAYRGATGFGVNEAGELEVRTPAGDLSDERPVSYQEVAGRRVSVATDYQLGAGVEGTQVYGFRVGAYDRSRELVIDPAILVYCGYLGGGGSDQGRGVAVDGEGNIYVAGFTDSTEADFPVTAGPDLTYNGANFDAFVAKLKGDGTALLYCGYIGGSSNDGADGVAVDGAGNAYVTGGTSSTQASFPVKGGPDLTYNGGTVDGFVAMVNRDGTALVYCGYVGGGGIDLGHGIAADGAGNAYITGETTSSQASFPVAGGPDLTYNGGTVVGDAFVAKVNAGGATLAYCGYIGGSGEDRGSGITIDGQGSAYVGGVTGSAEASFPVAGGPDLTYNGGTGDAFVAKVNAAGSALLYCGYIGGAGTDDGIGIAADGDGNAYVSGTTSSAEASFPVKVGPDLTYNGEISDAFVAKVNAAGSALLYCGYIGGSGFDRGTGVAVDSLGQAYLTGETNSSEASFPVSNGPDLTHNSPGLIDAFVAKIKGDGTGLVSCGYLGGGRGDTGLAIAVDRASGAYVTGATFSTEASFPVSGGPDLTYNGGNLDAFIAKVSESANNASSISAASFRGPELANESIAAAFGVALATATESAGSIPLPTALAGTTIKLKDGAGVERLAPLFFVSPTQVNYQIPPETALGAATLTVTGGDGRVSAGTVQVVAVAPGLFAANADGRGVAAAVALRIRADGSRSFEPVARLDATLDPPRFVPVPVDLGQESDQVFLLLFGTGLRHRSSLAGVLVSIGGAGAPADYAGPASDFVGLDQLNVRLPRSLMGQGEVDVEVALDGLAANVVKVHVR